MRVRGRLRETFKVGSLIFCCAAFLSMSAALAQSGKAAFVLIPGIFGSQILVCQNASQSSRDCIKAWSPADNTADAGALRFKADQDQLNVRTSWLQGGLADEVYGVLQREIEQFSEIFSFFGFSYDWRASNASNAKKLKGLLCSIARQGFSGIYIIAHSMGGLVLRSWLNEQEAFRCAGENSQIKILSMAFVATPHYGASETVRAAREGKFLASGLLAYFDRLSPALNKIVHEFPSTFELLPLYNHLGCAHGISSRLFDSGVIVVDEAGVEARADVFRVDFWRTNDVFKKWGTPAIVEGFLGSPTFQANLMRASKFVCDLNKSELSRREKNKWRSFIRSTEAFEDAPAVKYVFGVRNVTRLTNWLAEAPVTLGRLEFRKSKSGAIEAVELMAVGDGTVDDVSASHKHRNTKLDGDETRVVGSYGEHVTIVRSPAVKSLVQLWRDDFQKISAPEYAPSPAAQPPAPQSHGQKRKQDIKLIFPDGNARRVSIEHIALDPTQWSAPIERAALERVRQEIAGVPGDVLDDYLEGLVDDDALDYDGLRAALSLALLRSPGSFGQVALLANIGRMFAHLGLYRIGARVLDAAEAMASGGDQEGQNLWALRQLRTEIVMDIFRLVYEQKVSVESLVRPEQFRQFKRAAMAMAKSSLDDLEDRWGLARSVMQVTDFAKLDEMQAFAISLMQKENEGLLRIYRDFGEPTLFESLGDRLAAIARQRATTDLVRHLGRAKGITATVPALN